MSARTGPPRASAGARRSTCCAGRSSGALLRWRHLRTTTQIVLLAGGAASSSLHGLFGPQLAPRNLATVADLDPLSRTADRRAARGRQRVLRRLSDDPRARPRAAACTGRRGAGRALAARRKWLGARAVRRWCCSPTSCSICGRCRRRRRGWSLGYFGVGAARRSRSSRGAAFCKHVCPVGQFNFIASTLSPLELRVRERATCHDAAARRTASRAAAIRPRPAVVVQRGCELGLFLPTKVGNLDCTFCLDCVQACPHDNVAIGVRVPGDELADDRRRSAIGRLSRAARPRRAGAAVHVRRAAQRVRDDRAGLRVEQWLAALTGRHVRSAGARRCVRRRAWVVVPLALCARARPC